MEKSKKIVFFDIDYTLFDTDAYRRILYPRLAHELGIDEELLKIFRREFEPEMKKKFGHFSPTFFLQKILPLAKKNTSLEALEQIFWDKAIYASVLDSKGKELFEQLTNKNVTIGLLSTGDTKHQLAKIDSLLTFLPSDHHHIFSNKIESLETVLEKYHEFKIYIIDDLPEVLHAVKQLNPNVITIFKKTNKVFESTNTIQNFNPDFEIDDLMEILEIVM
ncbi:MAG: HAD family hydrolase [Candidatus Levybacteria bacterium]|nr:HAD family hydrolase [Candidatus Levybacteria bacterium]